MIRQAFGGEPNGGFKLFGVVGEDEQAGVLLPSRRTMVRTNSAFAEYIECATVRRGRSNIHKIGTPAISMPGMYFISPSGMDTLTTGPLPVKPRGNSQAQ